jgi:hemolysin D
MAAPAGAEAEAVSAERMLVAARVAELRAKLSSLERRHAGAEATARASEAEIDKLERTLPLLKEALDLQEGLERQGFGAKQKLLQQRQAYVTAQADLDAQRARLDEARAQVASLMGDAAQAREEFVTRAAQERAEAEGVVVTRGNTVREADQRMGLQALRAPVSGTVQELTVTNIGEVPEVGKPLVTIVPDGEPLVVEALLLNRDAGFVRAGMIAAVKLEAYPFTRYGTLQARVERVSPDATVDQRRGLVFPVRLTVIGNGILIEGKRVGLSPGRQANAEIVTGTRRVIEFLLSPIARAAHEAGRER